MKRGLVIILTLVCLLFCSCERRYQNPPVTMLVTQGFSESYYRKLAEDVKRDLNIDISFVYESSANPSTLLVQDFATDNLKADLVFTYAKIPNKYLENSCLDFISKSNLLTHYSYQQSNDFIDDEGCAYQLPLSSRLVGITYNATLMEEMGWKLPKTYNDMLDLKRKCDKAGILFSVTDIKYAGHPFNYLFNIMGSQWLSTVKGDVWFDGFLEGRKNMKVFKDEAEYFRRWVEDGMFGELADISSPSKTQFQQSRALFWFSNRNTAYDYSGMKYTRDGKVAGVMLNDVYKVMPWISEDGSNNCFTEYSNVWVMARKSVGEDEYKLKNVIAVLEYMMSEKYSLMALAESRDIYLSYGDLDNGEDRLYYDYIDQIKRGFVQPWYYNSFEDPTLLSTGAEIASYMINFYEKKGWNTDKIRHVNYELNPNANFDSAIGMLRKSLHALQEDYLGWADEDMGPEKLAELTAIACGLTLQETIEDREVNVGLIPYSTDISQLQPWIPVSVQNVSIKQGVLQKCYSYILEPAECTHVAGIRMTGSEIRQIVTDRYDPSDYFIDEKTGKSLFDNQRYGPYPYVCVTKGGQVLEDDKEYIVAVPPTCLEKDVYESFLNSGKVILYDSDPLLANLGHGFIVYFKMHNSISNTSLVWE